MHVSKNRLEGSLADARLDKLLEKLELHLFTGTVELKSERKNGYVDLRAGAVEHVSSGTLEGDPALRELRAMDDGEYVVVQRVPDLTGALGSSAGLEGEVTDVPIAAIMRHCEAHALTCSLIVVDGFDRGEIHYRAGDLDQVSLNGVRDEDAILTIVGWKAARFKVALPPLDLDIAGWPQIGPEPTQPFRISKMPPPKKRAASVPSIVEGVPHVRAPGGNMQAQSGQETVPVSLPEPVQAAVRAAASGPTSKAGAGSVSGTGAGAAAAKAAGEPAVETATPLLVVASTSGSNAKLRRSGSVAALPTSAARTDTDTSPSTPTSPSTSPSPSPSPSPSTSTSTPTPTPSDTEGAQRLASIPPSTLPGLATPSRLGDLLFVLLILIAFGVAAFVLDAR